MTMKIDLAEDTISMFLGLIIVGLVVFLVVNYVRKNKGNIEIPGVISENQESPTKTGGIEDKYTVKKGDSLWKIAESKLRDGYRWVEIAKLNGLGNPDLVYAVQELKMPETVEVKLEEVKEYVVKKGDSLLKISVKLYGDGYKWVKLWEVNKSLIRNPDEIEIGMKLATAQW